VDEIRICVGLQNPIDEKNESCTFQSGIVEEKIDLVQKMSRLHFCIEDISHVRKKQDLN